MTYERTVGRRLQARIDSGDIKAELVSGQWFSFEDANGPGFCQTDYYLICSGFIILIECKLTQSEAAEDQMTKLYEPVLRHIYECPVVTLQVCKNIKKHPKGAVRDIADLIRFPRAGIFTWHFLG